jgi:hypothetical protein
MVPSTGARSALSSFPQSLRSISMRHKLGTSILRCLLFISRYLRGVWSRYFPTSSDVSDEKKREGSTGRLPHTRSSWKREEYNVVCASRAFARADEQSPRHSLSRSSDREEPIQLGPVGGRSPNMPMPHSPSFSYSPSLQDSPRHSVNPLPLGNPNHSSSSLRPETPLSTMELIIRRSSTPVSWTHPRATSRHFTGAPSRSRSRQPSPSPSTYLFHPHFPRPDTPSRVNIEPPTRAAGILSQGSLENSAHSSTEITVHVEQPSVPGSPVTSSSSPSRLSPLHDRIQQLDTHHQLPSTESVNSSADSSRSRGRPSVPGAHRNMHPNQRRVRAPSSSPSSIQAREPSTVYPETSVSRISIQVSASTASNTHPRTATRSLRPMHSEQVSRYVKKGDV